MNVLSEGQGSIARQFASSGTDKFAGIRWRPGPSTGSPVLADVLAWIDCDISSVLPGGDHLVVHCRMRAVGARSDLAPLLFFRSDFVSARTA